VDCINEAADSVLAYLRTVHRGPKITGCWANLNAPGAGHPVHSHPNNYLSGVYYVRVEPGANTISVVKGIKQLLPQLVTNLPASVQVTRLTDLTTAIRASVSWVVSGLFHPSRIQRFLPRTAHSYRRAVIGSTREARRAGM